MKRITCFLALLVCISSTHGADRKLHLLSPDGKIAVEILAGQAISYSVLYNGEILTGANRISMTLADGTVLGQNSSFRKATPSTVDHTVKPLYGMSAGYRDHYNQLTLDFKNNFQLVFRVFDNGVAYRFVTKLAGQITIRHEEVEYNFGGDISASLTRTSNFLTSYEDTYLDTAISYLDSSKLGTLPLMARTANASVVITEADLLDYPGLYLTYNNSHGLKSTFPPFVLKDSVGGCCPRFERLPYELADYIAQTAGTRSFPWRLMVIAEKDKDLLYNNLVYLLASESRIGDDSWIKPGKVAWDWWSANNLTGVDFKTGFNTDTYKYFIDFAAANGIEYINMDEGWSDQFDLLKLNDGSIKIGTNAGGGLDMPFLFDYAKKKNVGIILWCVWHTLDRQMPEALDQFEKWGVKGLKVDFMDRDDQSVVNFYERLAAAAAKRKMLVNFHGAFKPTGLERTYPNIINREAVQGLEYNKFTTRCTPENLAHIPFIRMVAGSMDYTPGGLTNANASDFRVIAERPMTMGTRCQQLALFTVLYAPLEMLSDAPTAYEKEPQILNFLAGMPTIWDETLPLDGKAGDFAVIARKKENMWYVGGITDWTGRTVELNFDFLNDDAYEAEIFTDGPNANRMGNDYQRRLETIHKGDTMKIEMMNGGGFAIKLRPIKK